MNQMSFSSSIPALLNAAHADHLPTSNIVVRVDDWRLS